MVTKTHLLSIFLLIFIFLKFGVNSANTRNETDQEIADSNYNLIPIGVIIDFDTPMGVMAELCIQMALSDFYSLHSDYQTRLALHTKDSEGGLDTVSSALELLKNDEVQAIIVPQKSTEVVTELGGKAHVPIISFSETSPCISPEKSSYLIETTQNESSQVKTIASIVNNFGWHSVAFIYEDTHYGNRLIPYITNAFQDLDIQISYFSAISTFAEDFQILNELNKLITMQTRVFVVHMYPFLGSRFFVLAQKIGMMREGFVWIITSGMSNFLNSLDALVIDSMEGVLGVRPYVPKSRNLDDFETRWKRNLYLTKPNSTNIELNIFGLWAYDTIWALATAIVRIGPLNSSSFSNANDTKNTLDVTNFKVSEIGPKIFNEMLNIRFKGLSGDFHFVDGQLQSSAFEIFNLVGDGKKIVGYWSPKNGISRDIGSNSNELKNIIWPGDSRTTPLGWSIPGLMTKLRVGVPLKEGFNEFVKVQGSPNVGKPNVTGFCIDVFLATLPSLPFKVDPEFIPYWNESGESAGTYDELLKELSNKNTRPRFDAVVGDTTIVADRTSYVEFTLPYTESGVTMVVPVKQDNRKDMWIFIRPFGWDLWLTIAMACIFIGLVLRILERHATTDESELRGPPQHQLGMLFWFPLLVAAFPDRNLVANNWSRFVLVIWLFMMFVLMQSFTANLSSMLTIDRLAELPNTYEYVGYQDGSFVRNLLVNRLNFIESNLKVYSKIEEYHDALSKGSSNGGVDAIFDELPYVKLFLHRYPSMYTMVGPTYKTDGFGFAFPLGSPLVPHFSKAILKVTQDPNMSNIEERNFGIGYSSDPNNPSSAKYAGLSAHSFGGLFIIAGVLTILAIVCSEASFGKRLVGITKHCIQKCYVRLPASWIESRVHISASEVNVTPDLQETHSSEIDQNGDENRTTEIKTEREGAGEGEDNFSTNDNNEQEQHTS